MLCQSLRCTSRSSGDTLPRLNRVWKQFTVASEERVHRLEMAIAFHSNAEKVGRIFKNLFDFFLNFMCISVYMNLRLCTRLCSTFESQKKLSHSSGTGVTDSNSTVIWVLRIEPKAFGKVDSVLTIDPSPALVYSLNKSCQHLKC